MTRPMRTGSAFFFAGFLLLPAALAATPAMGLQPPASADRFAGTWQATFQGKPFLTLQLQAQEGKLAGMVGRSTFQLDSSGELTSAEAKDGSDRIVGAKILDDRTARITALDDDSQDTTQFEIKLNGAGEAEIQVLNAPPGTPAPKPWKLEKVPSTSAQTAAAASPATPDAVAPASTTSTPAAAAAAPADRSAATATSNSANKTQDMKSKLAAAAQIWLSGQFGTGAANANTSTSSSSSSPSTALPAASAAAKTTAPSEPAVKISDAPLDSSLRKDIDGMPRRVHDQFENQGDMVNFVLVGSEQQVQTALQAANWHVADTDNNKAVLNAIMQTYDKKDYLAMPMSSLYLYGRRQDFGYEMAEPYAMVASRHHFRIWKAPFTWEGKAVWAGAGTHDIGFEKDQRNGKVTHKIDPAVDGERDNIGSSLQKSGKAKTLSYYLPPDPVQGAKNATGGGYHSDGRILVVILE